MGACTAFPTGKRMALAMMVGGWTTLTAMLALTGETWRTFSRAAPRERWAVAAVQPGQRGAAPLLVAQR